MARLFFAIVLFTLVAGCSSVGVYNVKGGVGKVAGLDELPSPVQPLTVVFIHGIGDTCRGFALPDIPVMDGSRPDKAKQEPWLALDRLHDMGIDWPQHTYVDSTVTAAEAGIGSETAASIALIDLRQADYTLTLPAHEQVPARAVAMHAVEITWSPMTRWIKDRMLGYDQARLAPVDLRDPTSDAYLGHGVQGCGSKDHPSIERLDDPDGNVPPARLSLNGALKWKLMDRTLADAVIYAGTYGGAMQKAMAIALCRAVQPPGKAIAGRCMWPSPETIGAHRYVFVTHSLGSRLVYDSLLALQGHVQSKYTCENCGIVPTAESKVAANAIISKTVGVYMMANQLTMLGTANVRLEDAIGEQTEEGYDVSSDRSDPASADARTMASPAAHSIPRKQAAELLQRNSDSFINLVDHAGGSDPNLTVISFNDTNDLLTWHLPYWYGDVFSEPHSANVFLHNSQPFAGVLEEPGTAHSGYFKNEDVWRVMLCGATGGKVNRCLP